ncbi:unnamed protein product [Amoebophrya sp. A25]|nr:unnamed protein product [Amoebophrya sp. A25]|eukprot:GSA25T00017929001.1
MDLPSIMDRSGLLPRCYLSSVAHDKRVGSRPDGGALFSTDNHLGWEVWEIQKSPHGGVFLNSDAHGTRLACDANGHVYTIGKDHAGTWETWEVKESPHGGIFLTNVPHKKRLACDQDGHIYVVSEEQSGTWESWIMRDCLPTIFLSSQPHDMRLSSNPFCGLFTTQNRLAWERWVLEPSPNGGFFLHSSAHNKRLALNTEGHLYTIGGNDHKGTWEAWKITESPHNEHGAAYFIDSIGHQGKRLACDEQGHLYVVDAEYHAGTWESWVFERSQHCDVVETSGLWTQIGLGVLGAATLGVLAPFAVMGVVGALGFTASGIAGGSAAAAMMSAEAIATGGGIAAGGAVATLQAIGASGLGIAGTTAAVLSGAAIGGAAGVNCGMPDDD